MATAMLYCSSIWIGCILLYLFTVVFINYISLLENIWQTKKCVSCALIWSRAVLFSSFTLAEVINFVTKFKQDVTIISSFYYG